MSGVANVAIFQLPNIPYETEFAALRKKTRLDVANHPWATCGSIVN